MKKGVLSQMKAQSIQMSSFIEPYVRLLQHIDYDEFHEGYLIYATSHTVLLNKCFFNRAAMLML